jgi:hypothetical protein
MNTENNNVFVTFAEVDQSGKIEQFDVNTVVALSNHHKYAVLLPKAIKQELYYENKTRINDLKYKLFAITTFYCIKKFIDDNTPIAICQEYTGKELLIKSEIVQLLRGYCIDINPKLIVFGIITKASPAHELALSVFRKTRKPDVVLSKNAVEKLLRKA